MNVDYVEAAITAKTKAIMPVQLTGEVTDMGKLMAIAEQHNLPVVEDACQGILSEFAGKRSGTYGIAAGFSLHPLKNLNVWGDAGVVVTNDDAMNEQAAPDPQPRHEEPRRDRDPRLQLAARFRCRRWSATG